MRWWKRTLRMLTHSFFFLKKARDLKTAKASLNWCGLINIISDHKTTSWLCRQRKTFDTLAFGVYHQWFEALKSARGTFCQRLMACFKFHDI